MKLRQIYLKTHVTGGRRTSEHNQCIEEQIKIDWVTSKDSKDQDQREDQNEIFDSRSP